MKNQNKKPLTKKEIRVLLAEQHRNTRYNAIDLIKDALWIMVVKNDEGNLSFNEVERIIGILEKNIMNLKQKSPLE